jgi:hypothetical protein
VTSPMLDLADTLDWIDAAVEANEVNERVHELRIYAARLEQVIGLLDNALGPASDDIIAAAWKEVLGDA